MKKPRNLKHIQDIRFTPDPRQATASDPAPRYACETGDAVHSLHDAFQTPAADGKPYPELWRRDEIALLVPFLNIEDDATECERAAAALITLCAALIPTARVARAVRGTRGSPVLMDLLLAAKAAHAIESIKAHNAAIAPLLKDVAAAGKRVLEGEYRELLAKDPALRDLPAPSQWDPACEGRVRAARAAIARDPGATEVAVPPPYDDGAVWERLWPAPVMVLDTRAACAGTAAMDWIIAWCGDPCDNPEHTEIEPHVWRLLGLAEALDERVAAFLACRRRGGLLREDLAYQLVHYLDEAAYAAAQLQGTIAEPAKLGLAEEAALQAAAAASAQQRAARIVITGENERSPLYTKIALDAAGRQVALSANIAHIILLVGAIGYGKTHLMRAISEGVYFNLPGLNVLAGPQCIIHMETDFNKADGRRQMLAGFEPNRNPRQLRYLLEHYEFRARGNERYTRGILICLPQQVETLQRELAHLVERGLRIVALKLGPEDLGLFGYRAILANVKGAAQSADKPRHLTFVEDLIGYKGEGVTPNYLIDELKRSTQFASVKERLIRQLQILAKLVEPGVRVVDLLAAREPIFVLLESRYLSPDLLLPLQVALMNALARPCPGDPACWFFLDEVSKIASNPVVAAYLTEMAQEVRQRKVSLVLNGQKISNLPPDFVGLVTEAFLYHLDSPWEYRKLQEWLGGFAGIPFEQVRALDLGEVFLAAGRATEPEYRRQAQRMTVRPTAAYAGGETRKVV